MGEMIEFLAFAVLSVIDCAKVPAAAPVLSITSLLLMTSRSLSSPIMVLCRANIGRSAKQSV